MSPFRDFIFVSVSASPISLHLIGNGSPAERRSGAAGRSAVGGGRRAGRGAGRARRERKTNKQARGPHRLTPLPAAGPAEVDPSLGWWARRRGSLIEPRAPETSAAAANCLSRGLHRRAQLPGRQQLSGPTSQPASQPATWVGGASSAHRPSRPPAEQAPTTSWARGARKAARANPRGKSYLFIVPPAPACGRRRRRCLRAGICITRSARAAIRAHCCAPPS